MDVIKTFKIKFFFKSGHNQTNLPVAEMDDVLTLREKFPLEAAATKVSAAELAFGSEFTSLNIRSTSATMDPCL